MVLSLSFSFSQIGVNGNPHTRRYKRDSINKDNFRVRKATTNTVIMQIITGKMQGK